MDVNHLKNASMDDMVFEYRNKTYGAYWLRRFYNKYVTISGTVALGLFLLFIATPAIIKALSPVEVKKPKLDLSEVELAQPPPENKDEPPPPEVEPPPPLKSTIQFTPPEPVEDETIKEQRVVTTDDLKDVDVGLKDEKGDDKGVDRSLLDENVGKGVVKEDNTVYTYVEQMPAFPGGDDALNAYLSKNINYPQIAQDNDVQGRVIVEFIVGPDGKIRDAHVSKGIGFGCDEEALRVVKTMPAWTPGKQNGRPVNVNYRVPVKFTLH
jgi:protein TonB